MLLKWRRMVNAKPSDFRAVLFPHQGQAHSIAQLLCNCCSYLYPLIRCIKSILEGILDILAMSEKVQPFVEITIGRMKTRCDVQPTEKPSL